MPVIFPTYNARSLLRCVQPPPVGMFTSADFFYVLSVSALILAMPGPTNTLLFSSSLTRGFARSTPLVAAELVAYLLSISCWGFVLLSVLHDHAWITLALKALAAFYIAFLSVKIWRFEQSIDSAKSITGKHVFITTLLNPKAFLFASIVMPKAAFLDMAVYTPAMATFVLALIPVSAGWCLLGHLARSGSRRTPLVSSTAMLRGAALVLCFFSMTLLYDVFQKTWVAIGA